MNERSTGVTREQLLEAQRTMEETRMAAEKVEDVLRKSAASLLEAKEALILALLAEDVELDIISQATKTPMEQIIELKASLGK
ncbi:MAG: hypothetical protein ACI33P_14505 [Lysinibacillus sp.]